MSANAIISSRDPVVVKKKHVRFASVDDDDDEEEDNNDDLEEDTLFDKRKDRGLKKSALKAVRTAKRSSSSSGSRSAGGSDDRVHIISSGTGGACGRWMVTMVLCSSFLALGMGISILGPTFEDLAVNVHQNISNISYIFVGRSGGYIGGSLLAGLLFNCMNPHLLLGLSMLVTALGMYAIPYCQQALLLTGLMSSIGISMGFLDTGGNVLILNTWGEQSGPHMQALHFSFAAGAFMSPIIAKLLFGTDLGKNSTLAANLSSLANTANSSTRAKVAARYFHYQQMGALHSLLGYIVIGSIVLFIGVLFFILYARGSPTSRDKAGAASGKLRFSRHHIALIALLFVFFFWYVGAEVAYGSFIFTYAKDYAHMDSHQAAGLNSLFWGTFAAGRLLAIFFAACVYPGTMILLSLVGCTLSSLLLCLFSAQRAVLWACTAVYGASMATTFPSGISWLEQYTTVTSHSAAVFVVGAALGEMVLPGLLGFLLGKLPGEPLVMYQSLLSATLTSILFPVMYKLASSPAAGAGALRGKSRGRGRRDADDSEYRQALLDSGANDEEEEEEHHGDNEADLWNDADFEVIEMDDTAGLMNSPHKAMSPTSPERTGLSGINPVGTVPSTAQVTETSGGGGGAPFSDTVSLIGDSPRSKMLFTLDREKRD